jgi:PAS domain S-box-containing protein
MDQQHRLEAEQSDGEQFRLLVQAVTDYAIYMLDAEGRVSSWNAGAQRIKGYQADEAMGRHFSMFFPQEDIEAGRPDHALEMARREGRFESEGWRIRKDGTRFWANGVVTAVRDDRDILRGFAKVTRDFTERRRAEEITRKLEVEAAARRAAEEGEARLKESEERYRQQSEQLGIVLAGVADGIVAHDGRGKLHYANAAAARAMGYHSSTALMAAPMGEVLGKFDLFGEDGRPIPPDVLPGARALRGEESPSALLDLREVSTGVERWFLVKANAVHDPSGRPYLGVSIWHDVTAQRKNETAARFLNEATAVLSSELDASQALDRLADLAARRVADWCTVHVWEGDRLVPASVAHADPAKVALVRAIQARHPPDEDPAHGVAAVARTGRSQLYEAIADELLIAAARDEEHLRAIRALGLKSAIIAPLLARGRALGALTLVSAESGRRFGSVDLGFAEELGRRAGIAIDNSRLYREATEAVRIRDEFLSIAGHELKTPLAALLLQVEGVGRLLRKEGAADSSLVRIGKASAHGRRLEQLIDELLDVSRIASGRMRLEPDDMDLVDAARDAIRRLADGAASSGGRIQLKAEAPVRGRWDRLKMDQVVTNLVSNALKYGGDHHPIEVEVKCEGRSASLTVRDHGIGIDQEHQARIFGKFERAVSQRTYKGIGLGLWITRQIVEAHGGRIQVESTLGEGATFRVVLPC